MAGAMTRRGLFRVAGGSLSAGLGLLGGGVLAGDSVQRAAASPVQATIEPNTINRRGVGFRGYDPKRSFRGFTFFTPAAVTNKTVYLIDWQGNVVHTWDMPYPPGWSGYLTPRGTLFYNGKIADSSRHGQAPDRGGAAMEVDWKGRVLWEVRHPDHHHDGIRLRNGNVLLICAKPLPAEIVPQIRGGRPGTEYDQGKMDGDYLVEMTTDGRVVWEWRTWEHLDPAKDVIQELDRDQWTHANGVAEMPDGNLVVSFRRISTVVMINRQTGSVSWRLGSPPLSGQHAPAVLPDGHLLVFDNGPRRLDLAFPFTRVIEVDPGTNSIAWRFQEPISWNFFSPIMGNAQRLPNGNTFINEAATGRLFEVTPAGEVVWEYVNPHFGPFASRPVDAPLQAHVNYVFRAYRYTSAEIARARAAT